MLQSKFGKRERNIERGKERKKKQKEKYWVNERKMKQRMSNRQDNYYKKEKQRKKYIRVNTLQNACRHLSNMAPSEILQTF